MPEIIKSVMQDARSKPLPYVVQMVGLLVVFANLWIASRIAPIAENLKILEQRINAAEVEIDRRAPYVDRFLQLEARDEVLIEEVREIKEDLRSIGRAHGLLLQEEGR